MLTGLVVAVTSADLRALVALAAATVAFLAAMITLWINGRRAHRERLRELYAGGWAAVQAYKEMAFAIRRRNENDRASERVRLSETLREIQKELAYHEALIGRERAGRAAAEYRVLVAKTREIAGGIVRRSWDQEPITSDQEMHAPTIATELAMLKPFEEGYLNAVSDQLSGRPAELSSRERRATTRVTHPPEA